MTFEFDNVIKASSLTGKPLRVLVANSPPSVVCDIFHSKSSLSRTFRQHSFPAMRYLESLTLNIDVHRWSQSSSADANFERPEEKIMSLDILAVALLRMSRLRSLSLNRVIGCLGNNDSAKWNDVD